MPISSFAAADRTVILCVRLQHGAMGLFFVVKVLQETVQE